MADQEFSWPEPLPAPDFVMIPKLVHQEILRHLSGAEFKVFYCLLVASYEWGNGPKALSITQLIKDAGVGRGTVQDAVKELHRVGLITVEHHQTEIHGHEPNTYRVNVTDDPRYVDRHPIPKSGIATREMRDSIADGRDRSRARSSFTKNKEKEVDTSSAEKYYEGRYAVCPRCDNLHCVCANA